MSSTDNRYNKHAEHLPKKLGRPKKIENPDILWDLAVNYFQATDSSPWYKNEVIKSGDLAGCIISVPTTVPYTWSGLEMFCIVHGYNTRLDQYRFNLKGAYDDFHDVLEAISRIMYSQKFTGAAVGAFNSSIISADLGLANKTIVETKDTTEDFDYDDLSDSALEEIANAKAKAKK